MSGDDSPVDVALRAAAELKSAAAELGDEDGPARRQRFLEILKSAEKMLAPQQHPDFYQSLARWFPTSATPSELPAPTSGASPRTPEELFAAIKTLLPTLSPKDRQSFTARLGELLPAAPSTPAPGLAAGKSEAFTLSPETLRLLGVPSGTAVDVTRLAPFFWMLVEVLVHIDDVAWGIWESFGTDNKGLRREIVMKKAFGALLVGQTKLTVPQMQMQIAHLQRLTVELLAQMNRVGEYTQRHLRKLSPASVAQEEEAASRGWSLISNLPARCWERFSSRWPELESSTQAAVNKDVAKAVSIAVNGQRFMP